MTEPPTAGLSVEAEEREPDSTIGLVLDLDPDLGWGLGEKEREGARRACRGKPRWATAIWDSWADHHALICAALSDAMQSKPPPPSQTSPAGRAIR